MAVPQFPKAIIFDLMGTCLDWHSSITPTVTDVLQRAAEDEERSSPSRRDVSDLALDWRQGFFNEIHARFESAEPPEDIDITHDRVLRRLLGQPRWQNLGMISDQDLGICVAAWHNQKAWPDVTAALPQLRQICDVVVLANGTARLQIDITKSSGLNFDLLLSSELLGMIKPDPEMYRRALALLNCQPSEAIMVAAHAYDLRAAKSVGMHTVYLQRWTEDPQEDMTAVRAENNIFIDGLQAKSESGGLLELLELVGAGLSITR